MARNRKEDRDRAGSRAVQPSDNDDRPGAEALQMVVLGKKIVRAQYSPNATRQATGNIHGVRTLAHHTQPALKRPVGWASACNMRGAKAQSLPARQALICRPTTAPAGFWQSSVALDVFHKQAPRLPTQIDCFSKNRLQPPKSATFLNFSGASQDHFCADKASFARASTTSGRSDSPAIESSFW
jgi:hypothetical protein